MSSSISSAATKLIEKRKEYDAVSALERASSIYLERIEGLCEDVDVMASAGEAHGQVLEQWPRMFQILSLFLASRNPDDGREAQPPHEEVTGQRLVRIPIDELQQAP